LNIILAILPPVLIAYYVYQQDKYEREPKSLIIKSFLFGCISVVPILILETIFNESLFSSLFVYMFCGVALVEEGMKYFFLKKYLFNNPEFNEPLDGIVYAIMVSLGFATIENIMYVIGAQSEATSVAILRMFSAIPLHAACGVIMGYYVGMAKFKKDNTTILLLKGVLIATFVHAIYNYFLFLGQAQIISFIGLLVAIYFSKKALKIHQKDSQIRNSKDEVIY
jgi:protease PrsW